MSREPLPIDLVLPQLVAALRQHPGVVVQAPTGAGKTTRVPPALLDASMSTVRTNLGARILVGSDQLGAAFSKVRFR